MMIIGTTGRILAGQDIFSDVLSQRGFAVCSLREIVRREAIEKGIEPTRENLLLYEALRRKEEHGPVWAHKVVAEIERSPDSNYVISGIGFPDQVVVFREHFRKNFVLVGIEAKKEVRYERSRGEFSNYENFEYFDELDFNGFRRQGVSEKNGRDVSTCLKMKDLIIYNDRDVALFQRKAGYLLEELNINL